MYPVALTDLLGRQFGLLADSQLRRSVPDPLERLDLRRLLGLRRLTTRVLTTDTHPVGVEWELMRRVLDAGPNAVLFSKTAAKWFGFGRYRLHPVHIARPRTRTRPPEGAQLHELTTLLPIDCTEHLGIPITRPERTVLWLAGAYTHRWGTEHEATHAVTERVLEHAWGQQLIDGRYLHELVGRSGGKGMSGIVVMRRLLETRPPDYRPFGSRLELRFLELLSPGSQKLLSQQVDVHDCTLIGIVDFLGKPWPVVFEINGEFWHTSLPDRVRDEERYRRLQAMGYSVVVFWEYDIWHDARTVRAYTEHVLRNPDPAPRLHRPTPAPWHV